MFPSLADAESWLAGERPDKWAAKPRLRIVEDGPEVDVRRPGGVILRPHELTVRENWVASQQSVIRPVRAQAEEAVVYTWIRGEAKDAGATRIGGVPLLPPGEPWPACVACRKPLRFMGVLALTGAGGRSKSYLVHYHCTPCLSIEGRTYSAKAMADLREVKDADPRLSTPAYVGEEWKVIDIPWEPLQESLDQEQRRALGQSPYNLCTTLATKSGGLPSWHQPPAPPACDCGAEMDFVGQFVTFGESQLGNTGTIFFFRCRAREGDAIRSVFQTL